MKNINYASLWPLITAVAMAVAPQLNKSVLLSFVVVLFVYSGIELVFGILKWMLKKQVKPLYLMIKQEHLAPFVAWIYFDLHTSGITYDMQEAHRKFLKEIQNK